MKLQELKIPRSNGQIGSVYAVYLPKQIIDAIGWHKGDELMVRIEGKNRISLSRDVNAEEIEAEEARYVKHLDDKEANEVKRREDKEEKQLRRKY